VTTESLSLRWFTSSYSGQGGQCVEVAVNLAGHDVIPVRDSKSPSGPTLRLPAAAFSSFVAGVKDGHLNGAV
jgi:hypothetical protein